MEQAFAIAALWVGLALIATFIGSHLKISNALMEITVGIVAPLFFLALFAGKIVTKIFGLVPVIGIFKHDRNERWYYTLLMSTGLTFGTISALFGLTHNIVSQEQYSHLVAVVIASAVVPTLIAGAWLLPRHLISAQATATATPVSRDQGESTGPLEEG